MPQTFQLTITGQVQGVGFRPFIYKLAKKFGLKGRVGNNENGVLIFINATTKTANAFLKNVVEEAPGVSKIQSHSFREVPFQEFIDFKIIASTAEHQINIPLTPDFAVCDSCKQEIREKNNRRHGYAFTTCTNCGPRYAVTNKYPFERTNTTVNDFGMCPACTKEYRDPEYRRFHSQTNTCIDCGIQLILQDATGKDIEDNQEKIIQKAADLIRKGCILALKNTNGYLICCDANNARAIELLRERKQRPSKPFAILYPSMDRIKTDFEVTSEEEGMLLSPVAPIVILNPKKRKLDLKREQIAPGLQRLGVMLPSSSLLTLLMDSLNIPIVATSGNIHGSPIIADQKEAVEKLSDVVDYFLHHNLRISFPQDDSVIRFADNHKIIHRRSRGLAPNYLEQEKTGGEMGKILAMGAHLKSTFTFVPNSNIYVSQYFGNLDNYDVTNRFGQSIFQFGKLFETEPRTILIDSHPNYQSSIIGEELAETWKSNIVSVQHHKAHFASVLGEHHLFGTEEKILGVVWDGTGWGDDQAIWGGEFFSYEKYTMQRLTHFEYVDWLASDKMAKEPRLSLFSMLDKEEVDVCKHKFSETEWKVYNQMLKKNILKTSSVGRLFDAVASLLNLIDISTYEGEAAMLLENLAQTYTGKDFIDFLEGEKYEWVHIRTILTKMNESMVAGMSREQIANSFIHTLALVIIKMAKNNNFRQVACSGGVFQNALLISKLVYLGKKSKIKLRFNRILSSNDENISFGQLCYYQHIKNKICV